MTPLSAAALQPARYIEFHNLCRADELSRRIQVYERIAERATELSQARGHHQGYLPEDWLQAQSEFLRPVPVEIETFSDRIRVRATVAGFEEDELQASIEPGRIIIAGRKQRRPGPGGNVFHQDEHPREIFQVVNLPEDIDPELAEARLCAGVLEFNLFKALESPEWALGIMDG